MIMNFTNYDITMIRKPGYGLILFLLTGCFGETNCPAFPENRLSWIPYQPDSIIRYTDETDTVDFTIEETFKSNNYSFRSNCDCLCEANASFRTKTNNDLNFKIEGYSNYYGEITNYEFSFIRYGYSGEYYTALNSDDFYFGNKNGKMTDDLIAEFQIDNKTYKNVLKIELDTIDDNSLNWRKPSIWRIFIADSIGIIQFNDCTTRKTWRIIK